MRQIEIVANKTSSLSQTSVFGKVLDVRDNNVLGRHVTRAGDRDIMKELVGVFQGDKLTGAKEEREDVPLSHPVESHQVPMARLLMDRQSNKRKIEALIQQMNEIDDTFDTIHDALIEHFNVRDDDIEFEMDCYFEMVRTIHHQCYNLGENSFALRKLKSLGIFCQLEFSNLNSEKTRIEIINEEIKSICTNKDSSKLGYS